MKALPRVVLIGGAPLSGKTSLAHAIARQFDRPGICTDDISTAVRAITDARSHPALHFMGADGPYRDYYPAHNPERLLEDAMAFHRAAWPSIKAVVHAHARLAFPCVIEGWGILPALVATLNLPDTASLFLIPEDEVFEHRCRADSGFYEGAADEEGLIRSFSRRSVLFARMLEATALEHGFLILRATADTSLEQIRERALAMLDSGS